MSERTLAQRIAAALADKSWRLANLYMILDEDAQLVPFRMRDEQRQFLADRHKRNIVPKARKLGMSTVIVLDYLDECIFNANQFCAHIDRTRDDAEAKLGIARFAWDNGPRHPNAGIADIWRGIHKKTQRVTNNDGELAWSNGSSQRAAVSLTGHTPVRLHISEYGPIAAQEPARAKEIKRGSMNAVPQGGLIDIETTMEGGPFGECYEIFDAALSSAGRELTAVEWKMHFFPWFNHPSYTLPNRKAEKPLTVEYFEKLERENGLTIAPERQAWYEKTWDIQRENMWSQFPSTPAECVKVPTEGRIFEHMAVLRSEGRVREFDHVPGVPIITGWDLGVSDYTSGWAVQFVSEKELRWLDWWETEGQGAAAVVATIRRWEAKYGQPIALNLFPHDADTRSLATTNTYRDVLIQCGLPDSLIRIVPRIKDVWDGINYVRDLLPRSWFHTRCDQPRFSQDGTKLPSGVSCLEHFRKKADTSSGVISETYVHDATSHTASAARTIAEGWHEGLLTVLTGQSGAPSSHFFPPTSIARHTPVLCP